jgi:predicted metalloprotease with PDZ domain
LQTQCDATDVKKEVLGIDVSYVSYAEAHNQVLKVKQIMPNSPAATAGLQEKEFIIGYDGIQTFAEHISKNNGCEVELNVYNIETEKVRQVIIVPNSTWGGEGMLGCDVLHGAFH